MRAKSISIGRSFPRLFSSHVHKHNREYAKVVILRHGQSTWNQQNIFIGMTDTPLTPDGAIEAKSAGKLLRHSGIGHFDCAYSSLLRRSTKTAWIAFEELEQEWTPIIKDWRLNERNYGALVGRNKKSCVEEYGKEQVRKWRRSWDVPPPPMTRDSKYWPGHDHRYHVLGVDVDKIPMSESLKDVTKRTSEFWDECIVPRIRRAESILIVGHENNLRSIIKRLDGISDEDIINLELPRAVPLLYHIDKHSLKPILLPGNAEYMSGRYIGDKEQLKKIAERDYKQVYDLGIKETLETEPIIVVDNQPAPPIDDADEDAKSNSVGNK